MADKDVCDYPHSDSTWPFSPEQVAEHFTGVDDYDVDRMTHPERHAPLQLRSLPRCWGKEHCTVGARRRDAAGHDVSVKSTKPKETVGAGVRSSDLGATLTRYSGR